LRRASRGANDAKAFVELPLQSAILIIQIDFLKARRWRAFKKPILVFPAPSALKTPKSVS